MRSASAWPPQKRQLRFRSTSAQQPRTALSQPHHSEGVFMSMFMGKYSGKFSGKFTSKLTMHRISITAALAAVLIGGPMSQAALALDDKPLFDDRPMKMIVGMPAGGG